MNRKSGLLALLFIVLVTVPGFTGTIMVPGDQPTIQAGIDAAVNGDTVLVSAGTYFETIDFSGKKITVASASGPEVTIIDGQQQGSVVTFANGEVADSVLEGFTITGGYGTYEDPGHYNGGGVYAQIADPTITGNIFTGNQAFFGNGGAIYLLHADATITGNTFTLNTCTYYGAGIYGYGISTVTMVGNTFVDNTAGRSSGGISISCYGGSIEGNTFTGNVANDGSVGALYLSANDDPVTISDNIITGNSCTSSDGAAISCSSDSQLVIRGNIISGNTGKGIHCSEATVENNTISDNISAGGNGGGVRTRSGIVTGNLISGNSAEKGGGVYCTGGATVTDNIIHSNTTDGYPAGYGGGIYCIDGGSELTVMTGNTVIENQSADFGGGIACASSANVDLSNSIVRGNQAPSGPDIIASGTGVLLSIDCSNVEGGQPSIEVTPGSTVVWGAGNIDEPPFWCDPDAGDYRLAENCFCAPAQQPVCGLIGAGEVGCGLQTVSAELVCNPSVGTVPLQLSMTVRLGNPHPDAFRRSAGRIDLTLANGAMYSNWRAGYTNLAAGETRVVSWPQTIPSLSTCVGDIHFHFSAEDVTPPPFNQPPYPPAGDMASDACTVTTSVWDGTVEIGPLVDAYVIGSVDADNNYGFYDRLEVLNTGSSSSVRKTYLVFDVSELGIHSQISSATLRIFQGDAISGALLKVFGITDNDDWDPYTLPETAITYNNAPRNNTTNGHFLDEGDLDGSRLRLVADIDATAFGWKEVDITFYVRWALGHDSAYGFSPVDDDGLVSILIREGTFFAHSVIRYDSKNTTYGFKPLLHVVVAEP